MIRHVDARRSLPNLQSPWNRAMGYPWEEMPRMLNGMLVLPE